MTTDRLPSRTLPLLYFAAAHVALGLAAFLVAWSPRAAAGFFYHSRMVAIVHLVTLGWITNSILGRSTSWARALGISLPARRGDYAAFAAVTIGIVGMVAHFWIQELNGMAWSAATATSGILFVVARVVRRPSSRAIPGGVKASRRARGSQPLAAAASAGILLGLDKVYHFLPGFVLANVFAHAHLAALGWATMMVVGVGYRLLPMVIPAKAPSGITVYASAVLIERACLVLVRGAGRPERLGTRRRHPDRCGPRLLRCARGGDGAPPVEEAGRRAGGGLRRAACGGGGSLARRRVFDRSVSPLRAAVRHAPSVLRSRTASAGFSVSSLRWSSACRRGSCRCSPGIGRWRIPDSRGRSCRPFAMPIRSVQEGIFIAWTFAIPAVAVGFALNAIPLLSAGGWTLLAGVILSAAGNWAVAGPALPDLRQSPKEPPTLNGSAYSRSA